MKGLQKLRTRPFIIVDYETIMRGDLTHYEKLVYVVLCAYSDHENGTCYPSYNTIAAKAGCSRTVAVQAVKHLTELGFIQKQVRCTNGGHSRVVSR